MAPKALPFEPDSEFPYRASGAMHLNHSGVAPICASARDAMVRYAGEATAEPGRVNPRWFGRLDKARAAAAQLLNADADEIAFVKNTTHGLTIVAQSINWREGDVVIVEETTFPANWYVWKSLESRFGVRVKTLPERDGRFLLEDLERLLAENPVRLVSLSAVDYATGFRHDMETAGRMVKKTGAYFCVDGIQAVGAIHVDVRTWRADFLSADGHKWLIAPEGCALFYARESVLPELNDSMAGWIGREDFIRFEARDLPPHPSARRFEEGAHNHAGVQALAAAINIFNETGIEEVERRLLANTERLREGMQSLGWTLVSPAGRGEVAGISSFMHPALDEPKICERLRERGIVCFPRRGWLRFAPHFYQSVEEMDEAVAAVAEASSDLPS